jgi:hypothetical protein
VTGTRDVCRQLQNLTENLNRYFSALKLILYLQMVGLCPENINTAQINPTLHAITVKYPQRKRHKITSRKLVGKEGVIRSDPSSQVLRHSVSAITIRC